MPDDEEVDLVDDSDGVVGSATVSECLEIGLLHRAVAVLVQRSSGKIVLQQRNKHDAWHPGLWTMSSTGHVRKGEGYEAAAQRELKEEIGVDGSLSRVRKYRMPPMSDGGLTEREWVVLFVCRTDSPCIVDPVELEGVKEFTLAELGRMIKGGPLTPDARVILSDYLEGGPR